MIRFRVDRDNRCELTIKKRIIESEGNIHIKKEINKIVTYEEIKEILNSKTINKDLEKYIKKEMKQENSLCQFKIIGKLETYRKTYKVPELEDEIIIDRSNYFDIEDYEVECETESLKKVSEDIRKIFNKLDVQEISCTKAKYSRFIDTYKHINN